MIKKYDSITQRNKISWVLELSPVNYNSSNSFTIDTPKISTYKRGTPVKCYLSDGYRYSYVKSSTYSGASGNTVIYLTDDMLNNTLSKVYYGSEFNAIPFKYLGGKIGADYIVSSAGNDVTIKPGYVEVNGNWYYWESDITFTIGTGAEGSNGDSSQNPTSADMLYLYIDESH